MSVIDQAFIRAYEIDEDAPAGGASPLAASPGIRSTASAGRSRSTNPPHVRVFADAAPRELPESQRRPLSTFAAPTAPVEARFRPALEVDAFGWSDVCEALVSAHRERWQAALNALLAADEAGATLIGVGSQLRGGGATTVTGCLARLLVGAGKSVAIVDGDFAAPGLGRSLGLAADIGWEDVLAGRVPLADAVIHSLGDRLALLPLVQGGAPAAEKLDAIHASITAGVLRYHYDMVLFDLGALGDSQQCATACRLARRCRLDGTLLVTSKPTSPPRRSADRTATDANALPAAADDFARLCLGAIENQVITP